MTDFGDRMMDFIFENDVQEDGLTGPQYLKALAEFPGEEERVHRFFREWVWSAWCEKNLPEPEETEFSRAETERVIEASWRHFQSLIKAQQQS